MKNAVVKLGSTICAMLLIIFVCLWILPADAQAASQSDLTFGLNSDFKSYHVSGCKESASGSLTIPATYNSKPVTSIGYYAFEYCDSLTSVTIPDSVTSIDKGAFYGCDSLTNVTIPDSVTSIGDYAFEHCDSLTSVTIPDSVTSIGKDAFEYCDSLTSVTIGNSVTSIGNCAFHDCDSLTSVTIGNSVTSIGDYAFKNCDSLTSNTIPDSVTSIGDYAFKNCYRLTGVTIGNSVTSIGDYAFEYCYSLTSVTIGNSVTSIGDYAFLCCYKLYSITIPDSVTSIGDHAFGGCDSLTSVTIGNSVTSIGEGAFNNCDSLTSVTIPDSVTSIGNSAFWDCDSLISITIPDGVTSIGSSAFEYCDNLNKVFFRGTKEEMSNIVVAGYNVCFIYAQWHYDAEEIVLGSQVIYQCSCCDQYQYPNSDEVVFADIINTSWQISHAVYACQKGLMAGKGTDKEGKIIFDPNSSITREEFVQVLYNAEGKPSVDFVYNFLDVKDTWYKNAVLWAKKNDIANGTPDGNFGVGKNITRQDLALMLYKYAKLRGCSLAAETGKIDQFADGNKVASYAQEAMNWAVTNGVLSGKGETGKPISTFKLDPTGTATRAECAAMLKNFMTAFGL